MDVRWISASRIDECTWSDVPELLERDGGFVWVDLASWDEKAKALAEQFGFHALAIRDVLERSHLPKIHAYADHLFRWQFLGRSATQDPRREAVDPS